MIANIINVPIELVNMSFIVDVTLPEYDIISYGIYTVKYDEMISFCIKRGTINGN